MKWLTALFSKDKPLQEEAFDSSNSKELAIEVEAESLREKALMTEAQKNNKHYLPPQANDYEEEICAYFASLFPGREEKVFHEILSHSFHIDIHVLYPSETEPFYVLYSSGMSTLPMTLPEALLPEYKELERAELMMFLPYDWNFGEEGTLSTNLPAEVFWPIAAMTYMARLPHEHKNFISYGLTLPNGEDYEPFAKNTKLCGLGLVSFDGNLGELTTTDGTKIQIYTLIPLHKEELLYRQEEDMEALMDRILIETNGSFIVDINRAPAIANWELHQK